MIRGEIRSHWFLNSGMKGNVWEKESGGWHELFWPGAITRIKKNRYFRRKTKGTEKLSNHWQCK